jgi:hypothetical protein
MQRAHSPLTGTGRPGASLEYVSSSANRRRASGSPGRRGRPCVGCAVEEDSYAGTSDGFGSLAMGAGHVTKGKRYGDSETELFAGVCGSTPTDVVLTWAKAKKLLHITA